MIVFLRGIPAQTKRHHIREFFEPAIKGGLFKKKGHIKKIEIMVLRDVTLNRLEYHGLVTITPDEVAERAIKKLHGKKFMSKHIAVREYIQRDWHNDRRLNNKTADIIRRDRRETDRRRGAKLEVVDDVSNMFTSREGFQRKQGN